MCDADQVSGVREMHTLCSALHQEMSSTNVSDQNKPINTTMADVVLIRPVD
jgi:hypothetical protein